MRNNIITLFLLSFLLLTVHLSPISDNEINNYDVSTISETDNTNDIVSTTNDQTRIENSNIDIGSVVGNVLNIFEKTINSTIYTEICNMNSGIDDETILSVSMDITNDLMKNLSQVIANSITNLFSGKDIDLSSINNVINTIIDYTKDSLNSDIKTQIFERLNINVNIEVFSVKIIQIITTVLSDYLKVFSTVGTTVTEDVVNYAGSVVGDSINTVGNIGSDVANGLGTVTGSVVNTVGNVVSDTVNANIDLNTTVDNVADTVDIVAETASDKISSVGNNATGLVNSVINNTADSVNEVVDDVINPFIGNTTVGNAVSGVVDTTTETVDDVSEVLTSTIANTVDGVANISEDVIKRITQLVRIIVNGVSGILNKTLCIATDANSDISTCKDIVSEIINSLSSAISQILLNNINVDSSDNSTFSILCSSLPSDLFNQLTSIVNSILNDKLNISDDSSLLSFSNEISNNIITIVVDTIENLLCQDNSNDNGNVSFTSNNLTNFTTKIVKKLGNLSTSLFSKINTDN